MKAKLAAAVLVLAAASASAALNAYRTGINLPQAVKLGDGSVLPAGRYDVEIDYKGFGNAAELRFLQGGVLKGKAPAEARGFPAQATAGAIAPADKKVQKANEATSSDIFAKLGDIKGESVKTESAPDAKMAKVVDPNVQKGAPNTFPKVESADKWSPAGSGAPHSFSWGAHGFNPGMAGKASLAGNSVRLQFDSANSSAGFSALLPAVKTRK
jgi:hypothetical protein